MADVNANRVSALSLEGSPSIERENTNKAKQLQVILPMLLPTFIKDFEFRDIEIYANSTGIIFNDTDLKKIKSVENSELCTILMFHILLSQKKDLIAFLDILRCDYQWLYDQLNAMIESYNTNKDIIKYLNVLHELRSRIPKHVDNNVRRVKWFARTRNYLNELRPWHYLVIYGELGCGKKWLALDACSDYSVIKAMDYKIFWLDVHNCDSQERDLEKLQRLKILLGETSTSRQIGDYEGISNKILELQQDLKTILKQDEFKDCLLVLADVQNIKTIETFTFPCKILVTTRNKKILEYLSRAQMNVVNINHGLTRLESIELLERVMERDSKTFPSSKDEIIEGSECHPILLNIIAQSLRDRGDHEWDDWAKKLRDSRIDNDKFHKILKISLEVLRPEEANLFYTLSIFHHSVKIPLPVLASYWDKTEQDTQQIIRKFDRYFLATKVQISETNTDAITIHLLYYNYLQNCVQIDRPYYHRKLVESYSIYDALDSRTDINLPIANDQYFYFYIGYHLKQSNAMNDLFPRLYLDLGFLGQKLRYTGLPNTIGDLKYFYDEITEENVDRECFVDSLLEFLPNIEEMIFKSEDTCLMQYALMTPDLSKEALRQASAFPHNVWFTDSDHFHRRRQMVPLREHPKFVKLIEPNTCLVVLENHNILVADLSLNYSHKPTCFCDHRSEIKRIVLFEENFFISYDADRNIRVWSTLAERRESIKRRESLRFVVHQVDYSTCMRVRKRQSVQLINGLVQAFCIEKDENNTFLHTALSDGAIQVQKWNQDRYKFENEPFQPLQTNVKNIKYMEFFYQLYMILTKDARLKIFRIRDGSECQCDFTMPPDLRNPIGLHHYFCNPTAEIQKQEVVLICVFPTAVLQIRFLINPDANVIRGQAKIVYNVSDDERITCSTISDDKKYLIVGTKQGILVLGLDDWSEVLRNSISDHITCVDIASLDDPIYKYIILSASKGERQLNIFGLKLNGNDTLTWANSIGTLVNESNLKLRFEPTAWLVGKQLFDVNLTEKKIVVAIDSKNRIHHLIDHRWSIVVPKNLRNKIKAIRTFGTHYFYGCEDGVVYDSHENQFDTGFAEAINYLEIFEKDFLVISSNSQSLIKRGDHVRRFVRPIFKSYLLERGYLLIVEAGCSLRLCNAFGEFGDCECVPNNYSYVSADFKQNVLVVASSPCYVQKYEIFYGMTGKPDYKEEQYSLPDGNGNITALELSADIEFCAVGYSTGIIEIRKLSSMLLIQQLQSHNSPVYDMKFSPWSSPTLPIILASISEQICFWNVTHAINNPLQLIKNNSGRHSSRFSTRQHRRSTDSGVSSNRNSIGYDVTDVPMILPNYWSNKRGPKDKGELLACIKFAGNRAEKLFVNETFTEFVTIDDAGEIYFFKVNELDATNGCDELELETVTYRNDTNGNVHNI